MKSSHWINLGRDMVLVDERGAQIGVLHPLDEQIAMKIRKSLRNEIRGSSVYVTEKEVRAG